MNFNHRIFGHKHLLITQDKIGQSCTLFSKPRVYQGLLKIPNPAHTQVWLQSPLMQAVRD